MSSVNLILTLKKRTKRLAVAMLFLASPLFSTLTDHFKPALDKGDNHTMRNIDFIYTINLDQRPEKFASCVEQLDPYDIHPYRFSAVNGWELSYETLNQIGVHYEPWMRKNLWGTCYFAENNGEPHHEVMQVAGRNYFCHCMSRGAVGITLSHLSILQDAYDSGYETIWVMEDDILVIRNPHEISSLLERLDRAVGKDKWDILFTDQDTKNQKGEYVPCSGAAYRPNFTPQAPNRFQQKRSINREFRSIGARYGAYSMIVRRSGMEKLLDFFKEYSLFLPYDMEYQFPRDIKMITVIHDVVSTMPQAASDNGGANYKNKPDYIEPSES